MGYIEDKIKVIERTDNPEIVAEAFLRILDFVLGKSKIRNDLKKVARVFFLLSKKSSEIHKQLVSNN